MKTIITALIVFFAVSCGIEKQLPPENYITLHEIKNKYSLCDCDLKQIQKDARKGKIDYYFHIRYDQNLYDPKFNYSIYKR